MTLLFPDGRAFLIAGVAFVCAFAGCSPRDEPRRYRVPKEGAAVPAPASGATASDAAPAVGGPRLEYDTPEGWTPGNAGGMRKAAFVVRDGQQKVEVTVIDLTARAGPLLPNVNLWSEQIGLGQTTQAELDEVVIPIEVAGVEGSYVELLGPETADPRQAILAVVAILGERAWFFKLWGDAELALREKKQFEEFVRSVRFVPQEVNVLPPTPTEDGKGASRLRYETPEGWTPGEPGGIRKAVFHVADGDQKAEITAIALAGRMEALLPNVNLWRQKIQLDEIPQTELGDVVEPIQVAGVEGSYVEFVGPEDVQPRQAILRVVAVRDGETWLFGLTGDVDLALREKQRFLSFVRSVEFSTADGARNDQ